MTRPDRNYIIGWSVGCVIVTVLNLALLGAAVYVVVCLLRWMGVIA
jgi:hypothetical protein